MTRLFFTLLFLISSHLLLSQNVNQTITIVFNDTKLVNAIDAIEKGTDYHFYYDESWFTQQSTTGNFENVPINELLDTIFKNTVFNYYILNTNEIVLTRNNAIYDKIPEDFFNGAISTIIESEETEENAPIFYDKQNEIAATNPEIIRIGKESTVGNKQRFLIKGYIKNKVTNLPISNAVLVVKNKETGVEADGNGYFEISLVPGLNLLEGSALGFEDVQKKVFVYNNGQLNFELKESFESLEEIVLKANKTRNVAKAISGVSIIEVHKIKSIPLVLGERDILKVATTLPGITNAGEGAAGFNVRGGKTDQNLILLDNAVVYNPSHFFGIFSALNPFTAEDIKIYKGSIPSEFGGRLSSVFDIKTKDGNTQKFSGEVSVGPVMSNVSLEIPVVKEKASLLIGGRSTYSNWVLKSIEKESIKNSKASFYDVVAKYHHKINDKNTIKTTGYFSNDMFSITSDSLYSYNNNFLSFNWNHEINKNTNASLIIANSQYKFNIDYENSLESDLDFNLGYKIEETHVKYKISSQLNEAHKLNFGVSSKLYVVNPGSKVFPDMNSGVDPVIIPKERGLESALFVADNYTINKKLLVDVGFRYSMFSALGPGTQKVYIDGVPKDDGSLQDILNYDKNEVIKTYHGMEARISGRYFLNSDFSVKVGYNNTLQYLHTLSNNTTVSPTDTWKLTDLNIEPQKASQFSLGLFKNIDESDIELSVQGYYKKLKNILDYKVGADLLLNSSIESEVLQGVGKSYGVEFLVKKTSGRLNGWLGYSLSRSLIKFNSAYKSETINNGKYFPSNFDKPHDFSLVTNYKLTKRYSLSTNFIYQTGRPVTYPIGKYNFNNAEFVLYSDRNKFRIPDYYRLDLSLNIEGNHKIKKFAHSFWNVSVYNVLGRNNPYSVFFVTEQGEIKAYQSSIFAIPIPTITYNIKF